MTISPKDGPEWLRPFLSKQYFTHCKYHTSGKSEKNHFCIDCIEGPLCSAGAQIHMHARHNTLQVRRASHMDAVRLNDIQRHLDVSNIQVYTINGAKITFLLSRPHSKLAKPGFRCCEVCGRNIADPVRFCSIGCKLERSKQNKEDASLSLSLNWQGDEGHDNLLETKTYRLSEKLSDTAPNLCDSEDDMQSYDNSSGSTPFKKLTANKWNSKFIHVPLKKFKSQKSLNVTSEGREKGNMHDILDTWEGLDDRLQANDPRKHLLPSNWSQDSNQNASLTSSPCLQEVASTRVQRRKGIPRRAPLL